MSTNLETLINEVYRLFANAGVKILYALIVLIIGLQLIKWSGKGLKKSKLVGRMDPSVASFFTSFVSVILYILLILCLVEILNLPTAGFITVLASCSVAIGLSLQGALSNFAGALILLFFKPFKIGDFIEASGYSGTVTGITVFYTFLRTVDNKKIVLPNGSLTGAAITNFSTEKYRRVDLSFPVSYETDVEAVKKIVMDIIQAEPMAIKDSTAPEPPFIRLTDQNTNSVSYTVKVWCNSADYWDVHNNLNECIKKAFEKSEITLPYDQLVIHNKN